ncbi:DUF58 domain-containing protein [Natrialbaceae archaeon A-arb3/5]
MTDRYRRWRGAVAMAIILVAVALVTETPVLLLGAVVPLAYVAAAALSSTSPPDGLVATRSVSPTPAPPGHPVSVTLTLTNDGDRTLPDVRIADGVPADLAVLEGSPRGGATLRPGERLTVEYLLVARRGEYAFDPPQVRVRGLGAAAAVTTTVEASGDRRLACRLDADAPPLAETGDGRIGQLTSDRAGDGLTFHSTREYRPDDPADRIDWRQYAKRGTLATINYERQVATTIVLVVDARELNHAVAGRGQPTAVSLAAYAATRSLTDLLGHGHDVAVAVLGREGAGPAGLHWLPPSSGRDQRSRALEVLRAATVIEDDESESATSETHSDPASDWETAQTSNWTGSNDAARSTGAERERTGDRTDEQIRKVIELAPTNAQIALFSPVLDDRPVDAVERFQGAGLPAVLLSPDVIAENTVSGQYAQTRRRTRLARCQSAGVRTVDWRRGTPLPVIIQYAFTADARLSRSRLAGGSVASGAGSRSEPDSNPHLTEAAGRNSKTNQDEPMDSQANARGGR